MPSLDENGELVQQSEDDEVAFEDDQNEEDESEADEDDGDDADFQGAKSRSTAGGRRRGGGSKRGRPGGGRTGSRGGSTAQRGRPRKNGVNGEAGEGHDAIQADATNEDARARDDFSVEADNNLFSEDVSSSCTSQDLT